MTSFTIEVDSRQAQQALQQVAERVQNMQPVLQGLGDFLVARIQARFDTSTGPDGQRWRALSAATLRAFSDRLGAKYRKKAGGLNARGQAKVSGRKILVLTGDLQRQTRARAGATSVVISNSQPYAAIHQFGGQAGRGHKVTIPARPFFPVKPDGSIYEQEMPSILDRLNDYLLDHARRP